MVIIIGLGNPGKKYERNRHNAGFIIVDELRKIFSQGQDLQFGKFQPNKKTDSEISIGSFGDEEIVLAKPQVFMNNSGKSIKKTLSFFKPDDWIVIHDDLDIGSGTYKITGSCSAAGHNGVQDVIEQLGTRDFKRIRIGIETEGGRENRKIPGDSSSGTLVKGEAFVLQDFSNKEYGEIKKLAIEIGRNLKVHSMI